MLDFAGRMVFKERGVKVLISGNIEGNLLQRFLRMNRVIMLG